MVDSKKVGLKQNHQFEIGKSSWMGWNFDSISILNFFSHYILSISTQTNFICGPMGRKVGANAYTTLQGNVSHLKWISRKPGHKSDLLIWGLLLAKTPSNRTRSNSHTKCLHFLCVYYSLCQPDRPKSPDFQQGAEQASWYGGLGP